MPPEQQNENVTPNNPANVPSPGVPSQAPGNYNPSPAPSPAPGPSPAPVVSPAFQPTQAAVPAPQMAAAAYANPPLAAGAKSFNTTWLLALLLGFLGVDRFYLGKIGTGILKLLTWGGWGIWWIIDLVMVLTGKTTDKSGQPLANRPLSMTTPTIITVIVALILIPPVIGFSFLLPLTALKGAQDKAKSQAASSSSSLSLADWKSQYSSSYNSSTQAITDDSNKIVGDISNQDTTALPTDCGTLQDDVSSMKSIPPYPKSSVSSSMSKSLDEFDQAASDCIDGSNQQSTSLIQQAVNELESGMKDLNQAESNV